jgi:hypothetical protein
MKFAQGGSFGTVKTTGQDVLFIASDADDVVALQGDLQATGGLTQWTGSVDDSFLSRFAHIDPFTIAILQTCEKYHSSNIESINYSGRHKILGSIIQAKNPGDSYFLSKTARTFLESPLRSNGFCIKASQPRSKIALNHKFEYEKHDFKTKISLDLEFFHIISRLLAWSDRCRFAAPTYLIIYGYPPFHFPKVKEFVSFSRSIVELGNLP